MSPSLRDDWPVSVLYRILFVSRTCPKFTLSALAFKLRGNFTTPLDIRFGRAIRRIREEQGINQEEAAERCGLHRTYYSGIERGVRNVSLVNIERIGKGLKMALPEIFKRLLKPN